MQEKLARPTQSLRVLLYTGALAQTGRRERLTGSRVKSYSPRRGNGREITKPSTWQEEKQEGQREQEPQQVQP